MNKKNVYEKITDEIIKKLEKGEIVWKKEWLSLKKGFPKNFKSKNRYNGYNFFITLLSDYVTPFWLTYKQAESLGGKLKKGEGGTRIVFFKFIEKRNKNDELFTIPFAKYSYVYNLEQIQNIVNPFLKEYEEKISNKSDSTPIEACEAFLKGLNDKYPKIIHNNLKGPYYDCTKDLISLPMMKVFDYEDAYYATLFHELAHSTGHKEKLNRSGITEPNKFGSREYAKEELIAELTSCFLCNYFNIKQNDIENTAAYIGHWIGILKDDKTLIYFAMKEAFKILEYLNIFINE